MGTSKASVETKARLTRALARLAGARREKLERLDFEVFVEGLEQFEARDVETVCDELSRIAPDEFQPRFPPLHVIREACFRRIAGRDSARALTAARVDELYPPLSPEKREALLAQFRAVLRRKVMP